MKIEALGGHEQKIHYDKRFQSLDFELVKVYLNKDDKEGHYEIHIVGNSMNGKLTTLVKLHIQEAIEIKSIIDNVVFDANEHRMDKIEGMEQMKEIYKDEKSIWRRNFSAKEKALKLLHKSQSGIDGSDIVILKQQDKYYIFCCGNIEGNCWYGEELSEMKAKELIEEADYSVLKSLI